MDKELNSIADDIIKDSFGSAAPAPETTPEPAPGPTPEPAPMPEPAPAPAPEPMPEPTPTPEPMRRPRTVKTTEPPIHSGDPFLNQVPRPASPRETFTAEIPRQEPVKRDFQKRPLGNVAKERTNEYNRIKEQMSAARDAREASGMSTPSDVPGVVSVAPRNKGLNKIVLLFIILIPVVVVAAGVVIALLNQSSDTNTSNNQPQYVDPKDTAKKIDLSTYTSEIQITEPGYYSLTGITNFPIKINAAGEVTLYLHNVSVTATDASALSNFSANPLVIFMDNSTINTLTVTDPNTFDSIYSEGDLTIDGGTGILNVTGIKIADGHHYDVTGNGIKDTKITATQSENPENPENPTTENPATPTDPAGPTEPVAPTEPSTPEASAEPIAQPEQPVTTR